MKQVKPQNEIEEITRQVQIMLEEFNGHYNTIDYRNALDYFIGFKKNQLALTESIFAIQEPLSQNYKVLKEKVSLMKESINGLILVRKFLDGVLTPHSKIKPLNRGSIMITSYSLLLDLNEFHTFQFNFENGDPLQVASKHAALKDRLDQIRAFLAAL